MTGHAVQSLHFKSQTEPLTICEKKRIECSVRIIYCSNSHNAVVPRSKMQNNSPLLEAPSSESQQLAPGSPIHFFQNVLMTLKLGVSNLTLMMHLSQRTSHALNKKICTNQRGSQKNPWRHTLSQQPFSQIVILPNVSTAHVVQWRLPNCSRRKMVRKSLWI